MFEGELAAGEEHTYTLDLEAGTYVRFAVEQRGADLAVTLTPPDGPAIVADEPFERLGAELLPAVAGAGGTHTLTVHNSESTQAGGYRLLVEALRPASEHDRAVAAAYLDHREARRLRGERPDLAAELWAAAAAEWRRLGEPALEARAWSRLGGLARNGEPERAADLYAAAGEAFRRAGDQVLALFAFEAVAGSRFEAGQTQEALDGYLSVLEAREAGDPVTAANAYRGAGRVHRRWGELQAALDHYEKARGLLPESALGYPVLLSDLGVLHARFLGDVEGGRELIAAARDGFAGPWADLYRSIAHNQLAQLAFEAGRTDEARRELEAALEMQGEGRPCDRAVTLARLAQVDAAEGRPQESAGRLAAAAGQVEAGDCRHAAATVELLAGRSADERGDGEAAEAAYRRCVDLNAARGDRGGRAECLTGSARARRRLGDLEGALAAGEEALAILEGTRPTVLRTDFRMSFASELQDTYDVVIRTLLDLGREEEAWVTAERARARALGDLLREADAGLRGSADPALLERERELRRRLNELEFRRLEADGVEEARALADAVDAAVDDLERVRGEIRRGAPAAARLHESSAAELRRQLDGDTLLLEYRLGVEESVVWAVSRDAVTAHRLPPREELERLAERVAREMRSVRVRESGAYELAQRLLDPVAGELGERPLVLVPDGALETISFAALPDPTVDCCVPLVERHTISYLPSAATLAELRRRFDGRPPAGRWLSMVADPIYATGDERVAGGDEHGDTALRRLHFAGREAEAIAAMLPARRSAVAVGAGATRDAVLAGALAGARVVHFATHGQLNVEEPLLSRLVLSRFDAAGRPLAGDLSAHEIYDLDLDAELVVLSACDTARGRQVRGEGLVAGLPRAFLYAGAERVVVSLWAVDDHRTHDLMVAFYRGLFDRGLPPAQALQQAQLSVYEDNPSPYWWAAFVLQGDPRPLPPFGG